MKCLHCHKLTLSPRELNVFKTKFMLLQSGEYHQLQDLENTMAAKMREMKETGNEDGSKKQKALTMHNAGLAIDELLKEIQSKCTRLSVRKPRPNKSAADSVFEEDLRRRQAQSPVARAAEETFQYAVSRPNPSKGGSK